MPGSDLLDVLIGLAVVFLFLSLMAAAVREAIEGVIKSRAVFLERGIRELLDDHAGTGLATTFYRHPLIRSLFQATYEVRGVRKQGRRFLGSGLPTYIPKSNFSMAVLDLALHPDHPATYAIPSSSTQLSIADLRAAVPRIPSPFLQRALTAAIDNAHGDVERVRQNIEDWFDSGMDRVSGWYKRRTHLHLFIIGLFLTAALNVDTLSVANHLWRNKAARDALVKRADLLLSDSAYIKAVRDTTVPDTVRAQRIAAVKARYEDLTALDLPITWARATLPAATDNRLLWWLRTILGFVLTAAAVTIGAPFWFDLLNKMMVIRSTVKPKEKSQEEGSEDRKATASSKREPTAQPTAPTAPTAPVAPPPGAAPPAAPVHPTDAALERVSAAAFTAREWADGKEDGLV